MKAPVHPPRRTVVRVLGAPPVLLALCLLASLPAGAGGVLWRVSGGAAPGYLLGSLHFGTADMYPLHPRIEQALEHAERVMVEVNLLELDPLQLASAILELGTQPEGRQLSAQLPADLWQALLALSQRVGMPAAVFEQQQPWLAALTLGSLSVLELGLAESHGVDRHVMQRVQGRLPILELESLGSQLRLLSEIPLEEQVLMLEATVLGYREGQAQIRGILDAWRAGDGARLARRVAEDAALGGVAAAGLKTRLLDRRNTQMTSRIVEQLQAPGSVFVVVGAAHLVGGDSIVEQLTDRGYAVEPVPTAPGR